MYTPKGVVGAIREMLQRNKLTGDSHLGCATNSL